MTRKQERTGAVLDDVAKAIIEQLQQDGRRSYAAIGKEVGLSEAAVRQRVQRLIESGVMQVVAVTDPLQLGFARQAMVGIAVAGALEPVADALAAMDEVDYVVITAGTYDVLAEVVCESDEQLLELISEKIRRIDGRRPHRDLHVPQAAQADLLVGVSAERTPGPSGPTPPTPRPRAPRSPATSTVDVAIVGAGFTGLWTAHYLAEADPSLRIAVLEAETVGFGASGRNGGWCSALFPASLDSLARAVRPRRPRSPSTRRCAAASTRWRGPPTSSGSTPSSPTAARSCWSAARAQLVRARAEVDARPELGHRRATSCGWLDEGEARAVVLDAERHARCDVHPGLRGDPPAAPGARAGRLARPARGRRSTSTPASRELLPGRVGHRPRHGQRRHRRPRDRGLHEPARRATGATLAPVYSLVIATEPLPARRLGADRAAPARDVHRPPAPDHLRPAHRRRPAGVRRPRRAVPLRLPDRPRASTRDDRVFAAAAGHAASSCSRCSPTPRVTHAWGGPLGVPRDWCASVGLDPETRLGWAGGYVGDGVSTTNLAGRTLRDLVLERDTELTRLPWVGHRSPLWEPEPLRWLGVNAGLRAMTWADTEERLTGRPSLVARAARTPARLSASAEVSRGRWRRVGRLASTRARRRRSRRGPRR